MSPASARLTGATAFIFPVGVLKKNNVDAPNDDRFAALDGLSGID
jgi:hypothetical protein